MAVYQGVEIVGTFHTHLDNHNWAGSDPISQTEYFPNLTGTILYGGSAYTFNYSNGTNLGLTTIMNPDGTTTP